MKRIKKSVIPSKPNCKKSKSSFDFPKKLVVLMCLKPPVNNIILTWGPGNDINYNL